MAGQFEIFLIRGDDRAIAWLDKGEVATVFCSHFITRILTGRAVYISSNGVDEIHPWIHCHCASWI